MLRWRPLEPFGSGGCDGFIERGVVVLDEWMHGYNLLSACRGHVARILLHFVLDMPPGRAQPSSLTQALATYACTMNLRPKDDQGNQSLHRDRPSYPAASPHPPLLRPRTRHNMA